jgi:hypothetical protein
MDITVGISREWLDVLEGGLAGSNQCKYVKLAPMGDGTYTLAILGYDDAWLYTSARTIPQFSVIDTPDETFRLIYDPTPHNPKWWLTAFGSSQVLTFANAFGFDPALEDVRISESLAVCFEPDQSDALKAWAHGLSVTPATLYIGGAPYSQIALPTELAEQVAIAMMEQTVSNA